MSRSYSISSLIKNILELFYFMLNDQIIVLLFAAPTIYKLGSLISPSAILTKPYLGKN